MIEITLTMVIVEKELKDKFLNVSLVGREGTQNKQQVLSNAQKLQTNCVS